MCSSGNVDVAVLVLLRIYKYDNPDGIIIVLLP